MWTSALEGRLSSWAGRPIAVMQAGLTTHGQDKVLLFGFERRKMAPVLVCRLTRSARGRRLLYREAVARIHAWRRVPDSVREGMPRLEVLKVPGGICLVETFVAGRAPVVSPRPADIARDVGQSFGWLAAFQQATAARPGRGQRPSVLAERWIGRAGRVFGDRGVLDLLERIRPHLGLLDEAPPCTVHGDFWPGNFCTHAGKFQVIDWEFAQRYGNPWFDPVVNLISLAYELPGADKAASFERCFLAPTDLSRLFGRLFQSFGGGLRSRDAWSLAILLALAELASRWPLGAEASPKYPSLLRLAALPDPVSAVGQALWSR